MKTGRVSTFGVRRPILDQLEIGLRNTTEPARVGEIAADLERRLVDLRRHAAVVQQVVDEIARAFDETLAARFARAFLAPTDCRAGSSSAPGRRSTSPSTKCARWRSILSNPTASTHSCTVRSRATQFCATRLYKPFSLKCGIAEARVLRIRCRVGRAEQNPHRFLPQTRRVLDADRRLQQTLTHHADAGLHDVVEAEADDGIQRERAVRRGFFGMRRCSIGFGHWTSPSRCRFTRRDYSRDSDSI